MANKSRRNKDQEIRLSEAQMRRPGMEDTIRAEDSASASSQTSELAQEYRYVVADLRRIGIIAAVMLAVLIGLALFLA